MKTKIKVWARTLFLKVYHSFVPRTYTKEEDEQITSSYNVFFEAIYAEFKCLDELFYSIDIDHRFGRIIHTQSTR